jgi:LPXTG-site transpeptidase (sortase) family protein
VIKVLNFRLTLLASIVICLLTVTAPTLASNRPTIKIPTLNLVSSIVNFPIQNDSWAIDPWEKRVGFLEETSWFASPGNMVLAGHSVMPNGRGGIFAHIDRLSNGDRIYVSDGIQERTYVVSEVRVVNEYDMSVIYPMGDDRLTLITCEASSYDSATQAYGNRVVVIANRES